MSFFPYKGGSDWESNSWVSVVKQKDVAEVLLIAEQTLVVRAQMMVTNTEVQNISLIYSQH